MDPQTDCNYLEGCPIFQYFCQVAQQVYINLYCQGDYQNCERRKLRLANKPVPENLLPYGGTLWDEQT